MQIILLYTTFDARSSTRTRGNSTASWHRPHMRALRCRSRLDYFVRAFACRPTLVCSHTFPLPPRIFTGSVRRTRQLPLGTSISAPHAQLRGVFIPIPSASSAPPSPPAYTSDTAPESCSSASPPTPIRIDCNVARHYYYYYYYLLSTLLLTVSRGAIAMRVGLKAVQAIAPPTSGQLIRPAGCPVASPRRSHANRPPIQRRTRLDGHGDC